MSRSAEKGCTWIALMRDLTKRAYQVQQLHN